jgi:hypothetical protein
VTNIANGVAADDMPPTVVDALKKVDVHHEHADTESLGAPAGFSDFAIELGEQAPARAKPVNSSRWVI